MIDIGPQHLRGNTKCDGTSCYYCRATPTDIRPLKGRYSAHVRILLESILVDEKAHREEHFVFVTSCNPWNQLREVPGNASEALLRKDLVVVKDLQTSVTPGGYISIVRRKGSGSIFRNPAVSRAL
jgi:hypothetical protein